MQGMYPTDIEAKRAVNELLANLSGAGGCCPCPGAGPVESAFCDFIEEDWIPTGGVNDPYFIVCSHSLNTQSVRIETWQGPVVNEFEKVLTDASAISVDSVKLEVPDLASAYDGKVVIIG